MDTIFFDTNYSGIQPALIRVVVFLLASTLLLWLVYLGLTKLLFRKSLQRKELSLRLVFLWTLFVYFILFNVYLYILFYKKGADSLEFSNVRFYLGIMAQLIIYIGLIILFFIKKSSLTKIINGKSIN